jgi:hypothetical protein
MIAVGFLSFVPTLAWANSPVPITIGELFDGLPPVLFLHVFLAFPSGRLEGRLERAVVGAGYVAALGLQLVVVALGGVSLWICQGFRRRVPPRVRGPVLPARAVRRS